MKIGILGGGALGLAAGLELSKAKHQVSIYERAPFLGGQASTFDVGGRRLERGYHHLFTSDRDMLSLIHEIGLGDQMRWVDSKVGLFHGNKIYNFVTPMDLLRFTAIPLLDRIRLGLVTLYLRRYKNWRNLEEHTASEWIRKYAGENVYNVVWGPLLRGKFGEYYDKVCMSWLWGKFQTRFASREKGIGKEKLGYPMCSFGEVFEETARRIQQYGGEVHTSTAVKQITMQDDTATGLEVEIPGQIPTRESFDLILATVPSSIFPRLVPSLPKDYLDRLQTTTYLAAVLVVLVLDRPLSHAYWLNIADRSIPFVGLIEHTNFIEPEYYGGNHIVYIANYLHKDDRLFSLKDQDLLEEYLPHLRKINPSFERSWIKEWYYHREEAAQPVVGTGYSKRIPAFQTPYKNLYLANTTQIYPEDRGTNYSVRLGRQMADMLMQSQK